MMMTLDDIQANQDTRGLPLKEVGVKRVRVPVYLQKKSLSGSTPTLETLLIHGGEVSLSVSLPAHEKGTHLSRFMILLEQWREKAQPLNAQLPLCGTELLQALQASSGVIRFQVPFPIERHSPVTQLASTLIQDIAVEAHVRSTPLGEVDITKLALTLEVPCATLCPCSKAISDYGAHNQRAVIRLKVVLNPHAPEAWEYLVAPQSLIEGLESQASCAVYPILKRLDEKWVTERQYTNAKFVEDVLRDCILWTRHTLAPHSHGFSLEVEALESIHAHNAWCYHEEGIL
ncbi:MAG: GTP cyclohydrolase, FolE2/MptA family [Vampirovibrionales bacterium]